MSLLGRMYGSWGHRGWGSKQQYQENSVLILNWHMPTKERKEIVMDTLLYLRIDRMGTELTSADHREPSRD